MKHSNSESIPPFRGNSSHLSEPSEPAQQIMANRTLTSHGTFVQPWLAPHLDILDCGCGPGTITLGLANSVFPGSVTAIDHDPTQIQQAERLAWGLETMNTTFKQASVYQLPYPNESFDLVFSHSLFENLTQPLSALEEMKRVLRPHGILAISCPYWELWKYNSFPSQIEHAFTAYHSLQQKNGKNLFVGNQLSTWTKTAEFKMISENIYYENQEEESSDNDTSILISEHIALQLEKSGQFKHAQNLRQWVQEERPPLSQAWISIIAQK